MRCRSRVFVFNRVVINDNLDSIKFPLSKKNPLILLRGCPILSGLCTISSQKDILV
jgi:hypothetical protein